MVERLNERNIRPQCERRCDSNFREAVCIHTDKVYDSCRE